MLLRSFHLDQEAKNRIHFRPSLSFLTVKEGQWKPRQTLLQWYYPPPNRIHSVRSWKEMFNNYRFRLYIFQFKYTTDLHTYQNQEAGSTHFYIKWHKWPLINHKILLSLEATPSSPSIPISLALYERLKPVPLSLYSTLTFCLQPPWKRTPLPYRKSEKDERPTKIQYFGPQ